MKNKIKILLKKISLVTAQPDNDWFKVFVLLVLLATISLCWNVYFYFAVKHDIETKVFVSSTKATEVKKGAEEEMKAVIKQYDDKASQNTAIINTAPPEVADPGGA